MLRLHLRAGVEHELHGRRAAQAERREVVGDLVVRRLPLDALDDLGVRVEEHFPQAERDLKQRMLELGEVGVNFWRRGGGHAASVALGPAGGSTACEGPGAR
ncbi:hypothetical protein ACFPRL_12295 [Pseudoclavibacter helvolus]